MCFGGAPKPPKPMEPPQIEQPIDQAGQQANDALRKRLRAMSGYSSTSLTGGVGVAAAPNIAKTSLGA